jgi:6-pyruvoyltetrahydropterin/6-carboxytetrahydropterin synthase
MVIFRDFTFDTAHYLTKVSPGHKCAAMHGHTYRLRVCLEGEPELQTDWIIDFSDFKKKVSKTLDLVDHKCLNNIPGLENPTCELLAVWLWEQLKPRLKQLSRIELNETPCSGVIYEGK